MSGTHHQYSPGTWLCLSTPRASALVDLPVGSPLVARCWQHLTDSSGDPVSGLLTILGAPDLDALPDFAICWVGDRDLRVAVRGRASLELELTGDAPTIDASRHPTWYDALVPRSPGTVHLRGGEATALLLPLSAGVTSASQLSFVVGDDAAPPRNAAGGPAVVPVSATSAQPDPGPAPVPEPAPASAPAPALAAAPPPPATTAQAAAEAETDEPDVYSDLIGSTQDRVRMLARLQADLEAGGDDAPTTEVAAVASPATGAAEEQPMDGPAAASSAADDPSIHQTATWDGEAGPAPLPGLPSVPPPARPAVQDGPRVAPRPSTGGSGRALIDGAPWARRGLDGSGAPRPGDEGGAPVDPPAPQPSRLPRFSDPAPTDARDFPPLVGSDGGPGEVAVPDGRSASESPGDVPRPPAAPERDVPAGPPAEAGDLTTNRAALLSSMNAESVSLLGVRCPEGHANAPQAASCRVCHHPLADLEPELVERPVLGHLLLPNGGRIELERDVVLGRLPAATEGAEDRPHLVKISDSREVSRSHVRIRIDGWHVLLRDLDTTNHTWVTLPGSEQRQLSPHEEYVLEPGSVIDLAEEVQIVFEVSAP